MNEEELSDESSATSTAAGSTPKRAWLGGHRSFRAPDTRYLVPTMAVEEEELGMAVQ